MFCGIPEPKLSVRDTKQAVPPADIFQMAVWLHLSFAYSILRIFMNENKSSLNLDRKK